MMWVAFFIAEFVLLAGGGWLGMMAGSRLAWNKAPDRHAKAMADGASVGGLLGWGVWMGLGLLMFGGGQ